MKLKKISSITAIALLSLFYMGCGNSEYQMKEPVVTSENPEKDSSYILADEKPANETNHEQLLLVHTASVKANIKDVKSACHKITALTQAVGGYPQKNLIKKEIIESDETKTKRDSIQNTELFKIVAELELRIPSNAIDSLIYVIHDLSGGDIWVEHKQEDVSVKKLRNDMVLHRHDKSTADKNKSVYTSSLSQQIEEEAEDAIISNHTLKNDLKYSLISVHLSSPVQMCVQYTPVMPEHKIWETPFAEKWLSASETGWKLTEELLLLITRLWPLITLGLLIYIATRNKIKSKFIATSIDKE